MNYKKIGHLIKPTKSSPKYRNVTRQAIRLHRNMISTLFCNGENYYDNYIKDAIKSVKMRIFSDEEVLKFTGFNINTEMSLKKLDVFDRINATVKSNVMFNKLKTDKSNNNNIESQTKNFNFQSNIAINMTESKKSLKKKALTSKCAPTLGSSIDTYCSPQFTIPMNYPTITTNENNANRDRQAEIWEFYDKHFRYSQRLKNYMYPYVVKHSFPSQQGVNQNVFNEFKNRHLTSSNQSGNKGKSKSEFIDLRRNHESHELLNSLEWHKKLRNLSKHKISSINKAHMRKDKINYSGDLPKKLLKSGGNRKYKKESLSPMSLELQRRVINDNDKEIAHCNTIDSLLVTKIHNTSTRSSIAFVDSVFNSSQFLHQNIVEFKSKREKSCPVLYESQSQHLHSVDMLVKIMYMMNSAVNVYPENISIEAQIIPAKLYRVNISCCRPDLNIDLPLTCIAYSRRNYSTSGIEVEDVSTTNYRDCIDYLSVVKTIEGNLCHKDQLDTLTPTIREPCHICCNLPFEDSWDEISATCQSTSSIGTEATKDYNRRMGEDNCELEGFATSDEQCGSELEDEDVFYDDNEEVHNTDSSTDGSPLHYMSQVNPSKTFLVTSIDEFRLNLARYCVELSSEDIECKADILTEMDIIQNPTTTQLYLLEDSAYNVAMNTKLGNILFIKERYVLNNYLTKSWTDDRFIEDDHSKSESAKLHPEIVLEKSIPMYQVNKFNNELVERQCPKENEAQFIPYYVGDVKGLVTIKDNLCISQCSPVFYHKTTTNNVSCSPPLYHRNSSDNQWNLINGEESIASSNSNNSTLTLAIDNNNNDISECSINLSKDSDVCSSNKSLSIEQKSI